jgi:hypothetical protein
MCLKSFGTLTCCEGRTVTDVGRFPVRAVCPTDVMMITTDDNSTLRANKIGNVYSLEYIKVSEAFFTPHHGR